MYILQTKSKYNDKNEGDFLLNVNVCHFKSFYKSLIRSSFLSDI